MSLPFHPEEEPEAPAAPALISLLNEVPRSGRWVLPALAQAFRGPDVSTLKPKLRALVLLRIAALDRAPYWREQLSHDAPSLGISAEELDLIGSDEWETAPAFTDRERAAIAWGDRIARRLARRDTSAYAELRRHFSDGEVVELTAIASLGSMANRITNALRIAPEHGAGLSPGDGPVDEALRRWSRTMFDGDLRETWTEAGT